ncbi:hypothetical protein AAF712_015985 [Marasmius tenuissimus]|uniref:HMG box domain-containing protein n=1 Tax=Marasmius tenuissimus TaxID=585030 RepID=A0ABR2Z928_9AGAR
MRDPRASNQTSSRASQTYIEPIVPTRASNPPRPENAFMLYRRAVFSSNTFRKSTHDQYGNQRPKTQPEISKEISEMWRMAPESVKAQYYDMVEQKSREHRETYPGYKYSPSASRGSRGTSSVSSTSVRTPRPGIPSTSTSTPQGANVYIPPPPPTYSEPYPQAQNGCIDPRWLQKKHP